MSKTIIQINESEVLAALCAGKAVYRFNTERGTSTDLRQRSVKTISDDFNDARFLYFTISE